MLMDVKNNTKKRVGESLSLGAGVLFISLVAVCIFLFFKLNLQKVNVIAPMEEKVNKPDELIVNSDWGEYANEEYGFKFLHPKLLYKTEFKNQGGYIFFVKFEENKYSLGKGVAIGIRQSEKGRDVENVKNDIAREGNARLDNEQEIKMGDFYAVILNYTSGDKTQEEDRSIVIIQKDDKSYSISTVPEQIDKVISSFSFIQTP